MKFPRKPLGIGLMVVGVALYFVVRYFRTSDAVMPVWLWPIGGVIVVALIWYDIRMRKKGEP